VIVDMGALCTHPRIVGDLVVCVCNVAYLNVCRDSFTHVT